MIRTKKGKSIVDSERKVRRAAIEGRRAEFLRIMYGFGGDEAEFAHYFDRVGRISAERDREAYRPEPLTFTNQKRKAIAESTRSAKKIVKEAGIGVLFVTKRRKARGDSVFNVFAGIAFDGLERNSIFRSAIAKVDLIAVRKFRGLYRGNLR